MVADGPISDAVVAAIRGGRKIDAIKLLREETGLGLKAAKHAVEAYQYSNPGSIVSHSTGAESRLGRLLLIGAVVLAAIAAYYRWS